MDAPLVLIVLTLLRLVVPFSLLLLAGTLAQRRAEAH